MKKLTSLILLFLISSCGYDSYEECFYKEIKDGSPKTDKAAIINERAADSFCRSKFPKPERVFAEGVDFEVNFIRDGDIISWEVINYSDLTIREVKTFPYNCNEKPPTDINWNERRNEFAGGYIQSGRRGKVLNVNDPEQKFETSGRCLKFYVSN